MSLEAVSFIILIATVLAFILEWHQKIKTKFEACLGNVATIHAMAQRKFEANSDKGTKVAIPDLGTCIQIIRNPASKHQEQVIPIVKSAAPGSLLFVALFPEDDVPFGIRITNNDSASSQRDVNVTMTVHGESRSVMVAKGKKATLKSFVGAASNKGFHFLSKDSRGGAKCSQKYAEKHGMSEAEASEQIGLIKFGIQPSPPLFPLTFKVVCYFNLEFTVEVHKWFTIGTLKNMTDKYLPRNKEPILNFEGQTLSNPLKTLADYNISSGPVTITVGGATLADLCLDFLQLRKPLEGVTTLGTRPGVDYNENATGSELDLGVIAFVKLLRQKFLPVKFIPDIEVSVQEFFIQLKCSALEDSKFDVL